MTTKETTSEGTRASPRRGQIVTVAAAPIAFAFVARIGVLPAAIAAALAAFVANGLMNAPSRYRRHGWGQVRQAVDHSLGKSGAIYPEESVSIPTARHVEVGRNDPCPCGSGRKHKRCCGDQAR
jgi:hypothetical protein